MVTLVKDTGDSDVEESNLGCNVVRLVWYGVCGEAESNAERALV